MSKKCKKENGTRKETVIANELPEKAEESIASTALGLENVDRWNQLKAACQCETDHQFLQFLLDLAQQYVERNNKQGRSCNNDRLNKRRDDDDDRPLKRKEHKHKRKKNSKQFDRLKKNILQESNNVVQITPVHLQVNNEKQITIEPIKTDSEKATEPLETGLIVNIANDLLVPLELKTTAKQSDDISITPVELMINDKPKKPKTFDKKQKQKAESDIRKAPELTEQIKTECEDVPKLAIKIQLCCHCESHHLQHQCPLLKPRLEIGDSLSHQEWLDKQDKLSTESDTVRCSYAFKSLPVELKFADTNSEHGLGVFAKGKLSEFTQFGPLVGKVVKEVDVPEDCSMRDLYEINVDGTHIYFNTEDLTESNWLRFIRPAPNREAKNLFVIHKSNLLYFVTSREITAEEELLYWQDDVVTVNKKKMEKITCGGCNMTFLHPLYYRVHCSVFHDVRYSLTIRKYHCKVCGAAVLGKENIMKHATELHNGQGAYQCQFCKKFFLRLNYLEMHRTYGCSANPHRSRPLCDFCGRKFCQPQKLKVHIKRMHSELSEVLKEFQCKNCLKVLGSRAALQRHLKEVHQKQVDGSCACSRCGKLFQNKSNLKIHMLTHSGIKPFKCNQESCVAAFTTKQCLQFHYKKVHSFTEDMMPKIERTVDYTFEAYSGADDQDFMEFHNQRLSDEKGGSDLEDNSLEEGNVDDPPALQSPLPIQQDSNEQPPGSPGLETFAQNLKILSKGSKKWIGEGSLLKSEAYPLELKKIDDQQEVTYDARKLSSTLNTYNRHESSNASLLVEAALDSVCSEPNIDIDVSTTPSCTDALVSNLYTLSHTDALPDVTYSHSDSRDINLISPSVNDHISVTDDLNDELRHTQNIGIDYSSFQQEDFSPANSPNRNSSFVRDYINASSPQNAAHSFEAQTKSPSPPRYDFGAAVNQESDDSNCIGAQNLSLHNTKDAIQLDLSIYKTHYNIDTTNFFRKDLRTKFDEQERKQVYLLDVEKSYSEETNKFNINQDNMDNELPDIAGMQDSKHKEGDVDLTTRTNLPVLSDVRSKFEFDLELRKNYDMDIEIRRNTYESSMDDFRIKNYDLDNIDIRSNIERSKTYESLMEDFRTDRNFEPLVLNPSELQGLDMSARSYHNYPNLNRYHHLYAEVERPTVDLRLNYSPPPPTYSHADILRAVSLDLTPPGRHSVDLSLRSHQIANSARLLSDHSIQTTSHRLALDQTRLLTSDLTPSRHLSGDSRILSDINTRILSDHTTNRILSTDQLPSNRLLTTDQRLISGDDARLLSEQPRLLDQNRLLTSGTISPVPYPGYSVSPGPYHPTALPPRPPHATSPATAPPYHHYSAYY